MPIQQKNISVKLDARFSVSTTVKVIDYVMERFIKIGGIGVIAAVSGIFVFIFLEILPLFQWPEVKEIGVVSMPQREYLEMGVDQWGKKPFFLDTESNFHFLTLDTGQITTIPAQLPDSVRVTAYDYSQEGGTLVCGFDDGRFCLFNVEYSERFIDGVRELEPSIKRSEIYRIGRTGHPIESITYADSGDQKIIAVVQDTGARATVSLVRLMQEQTLLGSGAVTIDEEYDLTNQFEGTPVLLLAGTQADALLIATDEGRISYFNIDDEDCELMQVFQPFADLADPAINTLDYLFGGVSIVITAATGENRVFSLFIPANGTSRLFGHTKSFPNFTEPVTNYSPSLRNKAFLLSSDRTLSLRFATNSSIRWEAQLDYNIRDTVISSKYDRLMVLSDDSNLHVYNLHDPHPTSGISAFFSRQWFEGSPFPKFEWQSTGASDDYEPKLSMIPLIIGTLKGTFYAMLFATPLALSAALYTSQFLDRRIRTIVKPTMETMASLPSVVLGFLGALWLAPLIETRLVFIFLLIVLLPVGAILTGYCWSRLPMKIQRGVPAGNEFLVMLGIFVIGFVACWYLAPTVERRFFSVVDPVNGQVVSDFREWWRLTTNTPFEQRNSLIVGFVMGFAVIPIVFSIAEESLSNVPTALSSGALALGASRWQTAVRIVIPTASAGIFSALMMGLGRAVGETMIVLMVTGNTPVLDFNMFTGMRTLSANIAVELPEAPHGGTLYRTLFLGALILFIFTFFINTLAVTLREHLRSRFKTV